MGAERPSVLKATTDWLDDLSGAAGPLVALALHLAAEVDGGAGWQTAKELRATLKELTPDDGGDPFADLMRELSNAPARHAED